MRINALMEKTKLINQLIIKSFGKTCMCSFDKIIQVHSYRYNAVLFIIMHRTGRWLVILYVDTHR